MTANMIKDIIILLIILVGVICIYRIESKTEQKQTFLWIPGDFKTKRKCATSYREKDGTATIYFSASGDIKYEIKDVNLIFGKFIPNNVYIDMIPIIPGPPTKGNYVEIQYNLGKKDKPGSHRKCKIAYNIF